MWRCCCVFPEWRDRKRAHANNELTLEEALQLEEEMEQVHQTRVSYKNNFKAVRAPMQRDVVAPLAP